MESSSSCWLCGHRPPKPDLWLCAVTSIPSVLPLALSARKERSRFLEYPHVFITRETALGTFLSFYIESLSPSVAQAGLEFSVSLSISVLGLQMWLPHPACSQSFEVAG